MINRLRVVGQAQPTPRGRVEREPVGSGGLSPVRLRRRQAPADPDSQVSRAWSPGPGNPSRWPAGGSGSPAPLPALERVTAGFLPTTITARPSGASRLSQVSSNACSASLPIRIGGSTRSRRTPVLRHGLRGGAVNRSPSPRRRALSLATRTARSLTSTPHTVEPGTAVASASPITPYPQPRSSSVPPVRSGGSISRNSTAVPMSSRPRANTPDAETRRELVAPHSPRPGHEGTRRGVGGEVVLAAHASHASASRRWPGPPAPPEAGSAPPPASARAAASPARSGRGPGRTAPPTRPASWRPSPTAIRHPTRARTMWWQNASALTVPTATTDASRAPGGSSSVRIVVAPVAPLAERREVLLPHQLLGGLVDRLQVQPPGPRQHVPALQRVERPRCRRSGRRTGATPPRSARRTREVPRRPGSRVRRGPARR